MTWEQRMAARAAHRAVENEAAALRAEEAAWQARRDAADDYRSWTGTCDVCGENLLLRHSYTVDGVIDIGIDESGRAYTWVCHRDGPLQPDCRIYSSRVYEVPE